MSLPLLQGTIIVIIGVIGIVAFGSINSGLTTETNAHHLTYLWTRGNWLGYFFFMAFALIFVSIFTSQLDAVLVARSDLSAVPFSSMSSPPSALSSRNIFRRIMGLWNYAMFQVRYYLETWTAQHDDKRIAWTLGIGWACLGGGLAGGCLVFAKAGYVASSSQRLSDSRLYSVQLISGSLSHENTGNQFGQASSIFTFILLAVTAVSQIICLNRGLKVYDSTLVVPVFYGVYTAVGFLDSLVRVVIRDCTPEAEVWHRFSTMRSTRTSHGTSSSSSAPSSSSFPESSSSRTRNPINPHTQVPTCPAQRPSPP